jgi:GlpG protein
MLLGLAGFFLVALARDWVGWFTFTEVTHYVTYATAASFVQTYWVDHQWWRLITPAFLHFGIWHVLFNSMALWELGRRLEFVLPPAVYLVILLVTALAANVVQHLLPGSPIFGGLSGVVFGLFGAIAALYWRAPSPVLNLPRGLYILALVSLVVLPFVLEKVFAVHVANGAHVGGLLAGLVLGAVLPIRLVRNLPGRAPPNNYP